MIQPFLHQPKTKACDWLIRLYRLDHLLGLLACSDHDNGLNILGLQLTSLSSWQTIKLYELERNYLQKLSTLFLIWVCESFSCHVCECSTKGICWNLEITANNVHSVLRLGNWKTISKSFMRITRFSLTFYEIFLSWPPCGDLLLVFPTKLPSMWMGGAIAL